VGPQAGAERVDDDGQLFGLHVERLGDRAGALDDNLFERAAHLVAALGEAAAKCAVAGGVGEELEVQRAPFGVAGHRVQGVLGGELRLSARGGNVVLGRVGEDGAEILGAFGAAAVKQLEEELFFVGEVVVDGAAAKPGLLSDCVEARGMEAARREHARGGGEDLLTRLLAPFGLCHSLAFHARTCSFIQQRMFMQYRMKTMVDVVRRRRQMRRHPAPTFVFADLAGYTALTEQRGDEAAAQVAREFRRTMCALSRDHGAWQVKSMGDGVMIWAPDAGDAMALAARTVEEVGARPDLLPVRVGVHTGPAVMLGCDWYGGAVNVAARLAAEAKPNEALVSGATRDAARGRVALPLGAPHELLLRGLERPIAAWRLT
jgi:class 3 adenylate cyclase